MTDRWMDEAEKIMMSALGRTWRLNVEALAAALSDAHEAGRREEREACAKVADNEKAVWDGDLSIMAFSARKAAEDIAAAIRSREATDANA